MTRRASRAVEPAGFEEIRTPIAELKPKLPTFITITIAIIFIYVIQRDDETIIFWDRAIKGRTLSQSTVGRVVLCRVGFSITMTTETLHLEFVSYQQ